MTHLTEEQLVLHYYGDGTDRAGAETHLAACGTCRQEFTLLRAALDAVDGPAVPERGPEYGAEVWRRLEPHLPERRARRRFDFAWLRPPVWASAMAVAGLVIAAFFAGHWVTEQRLKKEFARGAPARVERVLVVAVSAHLERSQMVLAEIANAEPGKGSVDISEERQWAQDLLGENRLYRQTALRTGDAGVANVLDELERVLVEIANSPDKVSGDEFKAIRNRIETDGLLFKVRVIGSNLQSTQADSGPKRVL